MSIDIGLRHLRAVVAVADAGGYSAAARRLDMAQSSLSRTVAEAERRLGVPLFERTTRQVRPTPDGTHLIGMARRLLADFDASLAHFEGYLAGQRGTVSIAALPSIAATLLPGVLAAFRAERPEVTVMVRDGLSGEVLEMLRSGAVDLALTVIGESPAGTTARQVASDEFACVIPEGHELSARKEVRWSDLAGRPFVAFDTTSSIRSHTDQVFADQGIETGPRTEARNIGAVAGLTGAGLGVTAAPGLVLPMMRFAGLTWRPLIEPRVRRPISLVHHRDRPLSHTAIALARLLVEAPARSATEASDLPDLVRWNGPR
ncbi:LysR family transcriptional regulator [Nocardioides sambongensis]|uniref:LysR family transcriptional regulator n=1 Tax=Nocardioides sambongensis TaxID=2589074 RepID=UPI00112E7E0C|nr:LysR family transcriptional regulator [Nocardioides sambongensis]